MAKKCPKCESGNPGTATFCADCGTQLGSPKDIPEMTKTFETPFPQFSPGTSLAGRYEIIKELGKGGMGEVYLAEDTNLKRQVAIKVLPQQFAMDKERLARFEREARLLASINHPNIATIHGLEKFENQQFLVMELVEGDTLREQIEKGPLPKDEALEVCQQIAEGLESAHEKGIIHRDLKPANVKVTPEGKVKILDFGIAKVFQDHPDETEPSQSPVITDEMTRPGMILGTAAYMSPEQAKGKAADKRSDIWAFGCILFECLTGKRAFKGDTISEMLASILKDEVGWKNLSEKTPSNIRELIGRCLVKDARNRLHDIADARIVIQECISGVEGSLHESPSIQIRPILWKYGPWVLGGLIVGLLLATLIPWKRFQETGSDKYKEVHRLEMTTNTTAATWRNHSAITISPNGNRVIFVEGKEPWALYQRSLGQRQATLIPGTENAYAHFISPDGQWLGFFQDVKLKKMPLSGGDSQVLCDAANAFGGTWGPNGTIVFVPHVSRGLWRVDEDGGEPQRLTAPNFEKFEWGHLHPTFLPDENMVLFAIWYGSTRFNLALLDLDSGEHTIVLEDAHNAIYSPTGHLVFARIDGLYAVGFDLESKSVVGREVPLVRDVYFSEYNVAQFDISRTGTLAYLSGHPCPTELVIVDLNGNAEPLPVPPQLYRRPRFSPDGSKFAVNIYEEGGISHWIVNLATGRQTKLATDGNDSPTIWTPDGKNLTFSSDRSGAGQWKIYLQGIPGGEAELLIDPKDLHAGFFAPYSWSHDGIFLVGQGNVEKSLGSEDGNALLSWSKEEPGFQIVVERKEKVELYNSFLSPDGRWILFCENERFYGGEPVQVYVTRFPEGGEKYKVSTDWGSKALWSPDGKKIYYLQWPNLMVVDVQTEPEFRASSPRVQFNFEDKKYYSGNFYPFPNWDIDPDGKSFLMMRFVEDWEYPQHINITTNFFEELKEKVPIEN